jgi:hypothetical protein
VIYLPKGEYTLVVTNKDEEEIGKINLLQTLPQ